MLHSTCLSGPAITSHAPLARARRGVYGYCAILGAPDLGTDDELPRMQREPGLSIPLFLIFLDAAHPYPVTVTAIQHISPRPTTPG